DQELHAVRERVETDDEAGRRVHDRDLRSDPDPEDAAEVAHPSVSTWNPRSSPVGGTVLRRTSSTRAAGGPRRHQATNASTESFGPSACASTVPSNRFRTQPESPRRVASESALAR